MSMGKYGLLKRALSVTLATVLAVTLVPAGGLSFAREAVSSAAEVAQDGGRSNGGSGADAAAAAQVADGAVGAEGEIAGSSDADGDVASEAPAASAGEPDAGSSDAVGTDVDADTSPDRGGMLTIEDGLIVDESALSITVPAAVAVVDPVYFWQFPNAERIEVEEGSALFASYEGMLYTADLKTLIAAPLAIGPEVVLAPECEAIEAGALRGLADVERIRVSSVVATISMCADDPGESAAGYTEADLLDAELSAFSAQATREAAVQIDVEPDEAIDAAFAWYISGFRNVQLPEMPEDEDDAAGGDPAEGDADSAEAGGEEGDAGAGALEGEAPEEGASPEDAGSATDPADAPPAPTTPVQVIDTEKPLENAPQTPSRPQMITGEYDILGTLDASASENPDRPITSDDVLSVEVPLAAPEEDVVATSTETAEDDLAELASAPVPESIDENGTAVFSAARASSAHSQKTTYLNPMGGTLFCFYIEGNPGNWSTNEISGSRRNLGLDAKNGTAHELTHRGETSTCGASTNQATGDLTGNGYFHTLKMNRDYEDAGYAGQTQHNDRELFRVNVQCTRPGWVFTHWSTDSAGKNVYLGEVGDTDGLTLYANWEQFTLIFDPAGGTLINESNQPTIGTLTKTYTRLTGVTFYDDPTREGYSFVGWMITGDAVSDGKLSINVSNSDGTESSYTYVAGAPTTVTSFQKGTTGNATLRALWCSTVTIEESTPPSSLYFPNTWLYYYPGYGYSDTFYTGYKAYINRGQMVNATTYGSTRVLTPPDKVGGFTLKGFFTEENTDYYSGGASKGTLRITADGKLSSFVAVDGATKWYSQWEAIEYTITLDQAGGSISSIPQKITYQKGVGGSLVGASQGTESLGYTPRRYNWEFVGWRAVDAPDTITSSRASSGRPYTDLYLDKEDYGDVTFRAVWRAKIRLKSNEEAIQQPEPSTVTLNTQALYYYSDYGFGFRECGSGSLSFDTSSNFYAGDSAMLDGTKGGFTVPTCSNLGWVYNGFGNGTANPSGTVRSVTSSGVLTSPKIDGDTTWWVWWSPRTFTATLDPSPGAQSGGGENIKVSFHYGDTKLPGAESLYIYEAPTYAGWTFDGYYLNGVQYYEIESGTTWSGSLRGIETGVPLLRDCTLTAKWVRDITVDTGGGVAAESRTIRATYGQQLPASATSVLPSSPTTSPRGVTWTLMGLYSQNAMSATQYYTGAGDRAYNSIIRSTNPSTVYARWQRFVDVVANGGEGFQSLTIYKGITTAPQVRASDFTREGYTLAGFYQNVDPDNRGTKYFNSDGSPTSSCRDTSVPAKVYAHWIADTSVIAFDTNGGTGGPEDIRGVTGHEITDRSMPSAQPRMDDHFFAGWFTEREGGELVEELPTSFPAGGITYHAHWTPKPLSAITFRADANGALRVEDQNQTVASYTQSDVLPDTGTGVRISAVPDTGYAFTGWFDEKGNVVEAMQENWEVQAPAKGWPASTTYTARFELDGSKIAYVCAVCGPLDHLSEPACEHIASLHGLPGAFNINNVLEPLTIGAPAMQPYYRFTGWSGTGLTGEAVQEITLTEADLGDKSYTAHAQAVPYTLTLDAAGGSWPSLAGSGIYTVAGERASRAYTVETSRFQLPTPKREGYVLDRWVNSAGETVEGSFAPGPQCYGDMTLTAVWMRSAGNVYQIEYELGDDQGPDEGYFAAGEAVYSYNEEEGAALSSPHRVGYDFLGWTEVTRLQPGQQPVIAGAAPEKSVFIEAGFTGDRVFRAHWRAHVYDVAYELDGGAWEDPQPAVRQTFTYDKDVTIAKAPVRASYQFSRWERVGASGLGAQLQPGQVLERANLIAREGSDADDDGTPTNAGTVVLRAVWTPVLSFDVGVAATGVHLGLTLDANAANPFGTNKQENWGEATIRNRTASSLKVTSVSTSPQSSSLDYATLQANALKVFRDSQSLDQVSFRVRPAEGPLVLLTIPEFKLADRMSPSWSLPNTGDLSYPIGWMMKSAGDADGADAIDLYYQLSMGALTPADVNFSETTSLQVASVRFTVALVDAGEEV